MLMIYRFVCAFEGMKRQVGVWLVIGAVLPQFILVPWKFDHTFPYLGCGTVVTHRAYSQFWNAPETGALIDRDFLILQLTSELLVVIAFIIVIKIVRIELHKTVAAAEKWRRHFGDTC